MIDKDTMLKLANGHIANAPNSDWRNRGNLTIGGLRDIEIKTVFDEKKLGDATAAFIKFEHPEIEDDPDERSKDYAFVGFILTAMKVGKKFITSTEPVIGKIKEDDYNRNNLSARFCPQCHSLDSVKSKRKLLRPECLAVTYKCNKCSYIDHDVMD